MGRLPLAKTGTKPYGVFQKMGVAGKIIPYVNRYSFGPNRGLAMDIGGKFSDPNSPNLDKGILKAN